MEIKSGIIKDGMLHVLSPGNKIPCKECSLQNECNNSDYLICDMFGAGKDECFINRGKVTDIKIDKEE
ncbi:hypothetical protein [Phocaeicola massiliensis]|uniref:hypothetical protein n=1 Tax=Phocaeicola massiliensis TaxID=204516 RepID=UPI0032ECA8ED